MLVSRPQDDLCTWIWISVMNDLTTQITEIHVILFYRTIFSCHKFSQVPGLVLPLLSSRPGCIGHWWRKGIWRSIIWRRSSWSKSWYIRLVGNCHQIFVQLLLSTLSNFLGMGAGSWTAEVHALGMFSLSGYSNVLIHMSYNILYQNVNKMAITHRIRFITNSLVRLGSNALC